MAKATAAEAPVLWVCTPLPWVQVGNKNAAFHGWADEILVWWFLMLDIAQLWLYELQIIIFSLHNIDFFCGTTFSYFVFITSVWGWWRNGVTIFNGRICFMGLYIRTSRFSCSLSWFFDCQHNLVNRSSGFQSKGCGSKSSEDGSVLFVAKMHSGSVSGSDKF